MTRATPGQPPCGAQTTLRQHLHHPISLPANFRRNDVLAFHGRDPHAVAERVTASRLDKGLVWQGAPALLSLSFQDDAVDAELAVDSDLDAGLGACLGADVDQPRFAAMVRRMLGLDQDVEGFERAHRHHPELGPVLARQSGLRVPVTASPFEALSWAITGQQISVQAAVAIRRRMIEACGVRHSSGILCHPQAVQLLALGEAGLRTAGFTASKARTLLSVSEAVHSGTLRLGEGLGGWLGGDQDKGENKALRVGPSDIATQLLAVKGIGPWTVSYALMRGFGWLDGSLHGDVAVRRALGALLTPSSALAKPPSPCSPPSPRFQPLQPVPSPTVTPQVAEAWLAPLSPWRALAAAHLWASLSVAA